MKIYTKTGDTGETGLYGAERVVKAHPRVEAYGTVDEANSALGLARSLLPQEHLDLQDLLERIQNALFDLGADLATRMGSPYEKNIARMDAEDVEGLEKAIDRYQEESPPFRGFVLPGGAPGGGRPPPRPHRGAPGGAEGGGPKPGGTGEPRGHPLPEPALRPPLRPGPGGERQGRGQGGGVAREEAALGPGLAVDPNLRVRKGGF